MRLGLVVLGIHGIVSHALYVKRKYYPTLRDEEAVNPDGSRLTKSLAGRFENLHVPHWSYAEMQAAFGFSLEQYMYFGG